MSLRGPSAEEALLLYKQACSKPAAGSGWQMGIFFLSPFLSPKQQERCCQATSVFCLQPKTNGTEVGEEQRIEATDRNLAPF